MPAVSRTTIPLPFQVKRPSTTSRVVPATSLTMLFSSPRRRLRRLDFPVLGLPMMAMRISARSTSTARTPEKSRRSRMRPTSSSMFRLCSAEMKSMSLKPQRRWFQTMASRSELSALLTTRMMRFVMGRRSSANSSSSGVISMASTMKRMRSAFAISERVRATTRSSRPSRSSLKPPVSAMRQRRSPPGTSSSKTNSSSIGSRVTPGVGSVMARRLWSRRLKSVDLPTLGRPTRATRGRFS